jgi:sec-independent protein translocase protein TatC
MRNALRRILHVLLTPIRWLTAPFRAIGRWLNYEPEDAPAGEVLARTFESPGVLVEHIEALRGHLLRSAIALVITTGISFAFATQIIDYLAKPIGGITVLQAIEVTESVGAFMRVSLMSGFALALPYIGLEIFLFINPGLRRRERVMVLLSIPVACVLFVAGLAFAYFVMLPTALPFLLNFAGITTVPRPSNYIRFVTGLMFWIGIAFQFPLVIYAMAALGFVRARTLRNGWRVAVVVIAIMAAAITPTVDPINMGLVMGPMIVLYFLSIGMAAIAERARDRRIRRAASS